MKMIRRIERLLNVDRKKYDATIPPPASAEELRECQDALKKKGFPHIPQQYFAFLRNCCNGYYHRVMFYGTKRLYVPYPDNIVDDLVTANERRHEALLRWSPNQRPVLALYIGEAWKGDFYCEYYYNVTSGLYMRSSDDAEAREYKTFADMFEAESRCFN